MIDFLDPGILTIDFVDDQDDRVFFGQGLFENEPRLRKGPLARIHQQHRAIHHIEAALHLPPEIGVSRRIHNIDFDLVVIDRRVFAMMVIPRSRSRSMESMMRSLTSWFSLKTPVCLSMPSTSVVFPWSTWAIMAMFLMFSFLMICFPNSDSRTDVQDVTVFDDVVLSFEPEPTFFTNAFF